MTVIAIDGPAASGKGTLARALANHLDYAYLDTGTLYRAVGLTVSQEGGDVENEQDALAVARKLGNINLNDPAIRGESTGRLASKIAIHPAVRNELLAFQRNFARNPPAGKGGAVLDGRDIGTVICPDADVKIFIVANVETRAKRRFLEEFGEKGTDQQYQTILNDLKARDARDQNRRTSPLKKAENAHLLDTSNSDIEAVFEQALALISDRMTKN